MENLDISSADSLNFELLPQHMIVNQLYDLDVTFQSRQCIFGGHMVKVLNEENISLKLNNRSSDFETDNKENFLSHSYTCDLLMASYPSIHKNSNTFIPFDISIIDQF